MKQAFILSLSLSTVVFACQGPTVVVVRPPVEPSEEEPIVELAKVARPTKTSEPLPVVIAAEPAPVPQDVPSDAEARAALDRGLAWLAESQHEDGYWSSESGVHRDVGVTGLALLALFEAGNTINTGCYRDEVALGLKWLRAQQDPETGLIGERRAHDFLYGHGIATLAVCEHYGASRSPLLERTAEAAIQLVLTARNPYSAWRYDVPPIGDNDTSVTGWMLAALVAAREAGIEIDEAALDGGIDWIDEVTDPRTGRVGYDSMGSLSSRTPQNQTYPREKGEAMTAVGLASRIDVQGAQQADRAVLHQHAGLMRRRLPVWDPAALGVDMYYWFHGTRAMKRMGGGYWQAWRDALLAASVPSQREDGSWDPIGPWGYSGGRSYATALVTACLAECL